MDLIPKCITKRADGVDQTINIDHILDGLEVEDADFTEVESPGDDVESGDEEASEDSVE